MRPILFVTTLFLLSYTLSACDAIIGSVGELPEDINNCQGGSDVCPSNTNDPTSSSFTLPSIRYGDGTDLNNVYTLTTNDAVLSWEVVDDNGSPITFDYSFEFAYAEPGGTLGAFQDIGTNTSITLTNLLETFGNETYTFQINATYSDAGVTKDTTFSGSFIVDAVQSRGFLFNPSRLESNSDGSYTAKIYLDNLEATDDLTAFTLAISYSTASFNVTANDIRVYDAATSFLGRDNAEVIVIPEFSSNLILLNVGMAGNNLTPLSGGGAVCDITFYPTNSFTGTANFTITTASVLSNSVGNEITIQNYGEASITQ